MTVRRLVTLTVALCLLVVLGILVVPRLLERAPESTEDPAPVVDLAQPAYAYATETQLVLMRGDQRVTSVTRVFDLSDSRQNQVVWTHSGTFVAFLAGVGLVQEDPSTEKLVAVDTRTGERVELPCPDCDQLVAVGDDRVLADNGEFLVFDLAKPTADPVSVPNPDSTGDYRTILLAGTGHRVLATQTTQQGSSDFLERVTLMSVDEATTSPVGMVDSNSSMPAAALSGSDERSDRFAFAARNNPGLCPSAFPVYVIGGDGSAVETDLSAAAPPGFVPNEVNGMEVKDLWWDSAGTLHATIESWTCDESQPDHQRMKVPHASPSLWRLDGEAWVQEDTAPVTMARRLSDSATIALRVPDCIGPADVPDPVTYCAIGELTLLDGDRRTSIADDVLGIYVPPAAAPDAPPAPTVDLDALATAPVPSLCEHPEGTLVDGALPGIPPENGFVALRATVEPEASTDLVATTDLTGDGRPETAAVFACSQGGVNWPNVIVVYDPELRVLGAIDLGDLGESEHAEVESVRGAGAVVTVRWSSYDGAGFCAKNWTAGLHWTGTTVGVTGQEQLADTDETC